MILLKSIVLIPPRHGREDFAIRETLDQLGLDYLDLFLVHWPQRRDDGKFDHVETWKAMEKLVRVDKGARFIGISNHSPLQVKEVVEAATIRPKVHQFESHPYLQQNDAVKQNMAYGITVTGYAPLGNTNPVHNLGVAANSEGNRAPPILQNAAIVEAAKARGCTPAQVVLAWNVKRGTAVIPKASQVVHQKENIVTLQKCKITDEDAAKIADIRKSFEVRLYENVCRFGSTDGCSKKALEGRRPGK
jgi:alcohol dehydrogenase (NADP+)